MDAPVVLEVEPEDAIVRVALVFAGADDHAARVLAERIEEIVRVDGDAEGRELRQSDVDVRGEVAGALVDVPGDDALQLDGILLAGNPDVRRAVIVRVFVESGECEKGAKGGGSIQSNEFNFSVVDKNVADSLMLCSGKNVELHYKEYNGWLPWRGMQRYVVDKIVSVEPASTTSEIPIITGTESL